MPLIDGRRLFDLAVVSLASVPALLLAMLVGLGVLLTSGRPVLYGCRRVGRDGELFTMWKFRTMSSGADGPAVTVREDARITGIGKALRRWRLDELPQLVNILAGHMAIFGPRPEDPKYVDLEDSVHACVLSVRPGLLSPASLEFHDEARLLEAGDADRVYRETILPNKLAIDAEWIRSRSLIKDLWLVVRLVSSEGPARRWNSR